MSHFKSAEERVQTPSNSLSDDRNDAILGASVYDGMNDMLIPMEEDLDSQLKSKEANNVADATLNSMNHIGDDDNDDDEEDEHDILNRYDDKKTRKSSIPIILCLVSGLLILVIVAGIIVGKSNNVPNKQESSYKEELLSSPNTDYLRDVLFNLTSYEHMAGTPGDYNVAMYIYNKMKEYGFNQNENSNSINDTSTTGVYIQKIDNIQLSYPNNSQLYLLNKNDYNEIIYSCKLEESIIDQDPTSTSNFRKQAWLAYAASGEALGDLVYVNYGRHSDYNELINSYNINLTNKIGIARYGGSLFRGTKMRIAEEYGLSGLIIYSDPKDDGFVRGDVFPDGPWRPKTGIQRGSTHFGATCPGNPEPSRVSEICHLNKTEIEPIIPAIPINSRDARPLLNALSGDSVPSDWQGGLNISYKIGGNGNTIVKLINNNNNEEIRSIYNIIGYIEGTTYKNESILLGNHHDAWVFGAADPGSGTTVMLEISRAFQHIYSLGWRPKRNIYFASWDAEEHGLFGSIAFSEQNASFVENQLVGYLNTDVAVSGHSIYVEAHPLFNAFATNVMAEISISSDNGDMSLFDYWQSLNGSIGSLGIGSDYASFLNHYGIACLDSGFYGEYGTYHSVYDSFTWMELVDKEFTYHQTLAKFFALMLYELAENDLISFNLREFANTIQVWYLDTVSLADEYNCDLGQSNDVENANYELQQTLLLFKEACDTAQEYIESLNVTASPTEEIMYYNQLLKNIGKQFLYQEGLPGRYYYKNIITAPNLDTGYTGQYFPYIAYGIKFNCTNEMLMEAFTITENVVNNALQFVESFDF